MKGKIWFSSSYSWYIILCCLCNQCNVMLDTSILYICTQMSKWIGNYLLLLIHYCNDCIMAMIYSYPQGQHNNRLPCFQNGVHVFIFQNQDYIFWKYSRIGFSIFYIINFCLLAFVYLNIWLSMKSLTFFFKFDGTSLMRSNSNG